MSTDAEPSQPLIDLGALQLAYPDSAFAIEIPELRLAPGRTLCLVGPSGSGKTTLLHALAGIHVPSAGRLRVLGEDLAPGSALARDESARRRFRRTRLGLVFQTFALLPYLTVADNLRLPVLYHPELDSGQRSREQVGDIAARLGIGDKLARLPQHLSQGERQRVAIGRALLFSPALLLADEPTGNLDPKTTETILELFLETVGERKAGLVMVTHDHSLAARFDAVLDLGELACGMVS